ncbi:MAG: hypothetical protein FJ303_10635 [Planctomycetes bacterium]|nr:hypothetical protein [Planctomycetota bacterium]
MSLAAGRYQIANAHKALKQEWEATENVWRDVIRKEFANDFWEPLSIRIGAMLTAIDRLDQKLAQMKNDCE